MSAEPGPRPRWRTAACCAALALALGACARPAWKVVLEKRPGALISVWGASASDVWAVGGDAGDGPEVLHYDGREWSRLESLTRGDLWWVFGFPQGPVFMGGAAGVTLRYRNGVFEALAAPVASARTVFGLWGPTPDDVWAVGGDGNSNAFVWRFDGTAWREVALPPGVMTGHSLFKVWGRSADDVWLVGSLGLSLHWDGATFTQVPTGTNRTLFTVHGGGGRLAAVGGFGAAVVLEHDGSGWVDRSPAEAKQAIGVSLSERGGWAVGSNGSVMERRTDGWFVETEGPDVFEDLHGVWVDPQGGVWAVGGQVAAFPLVKGVLVYRGTAPPASRVLGSP